jgi:hypothetical protein
MSFGFRHSWTIEAEEAIFHIGFIMACYHPRVDFQSPQNIAEFYMAMTIDELRNNITVQGIPNLFLDIFRKAH